ncbi:hypothetical protein CY35_07G106000 [Sphagnum magellanicum]|uniref:Uncharacterized protein n=2 Tax=Sphagnum magellanicum TaxID=128215 RepID=A0ACB8HNS5_9BRYO|nr:hypothetical protein CY35_07G106000 [Sphagnum magellanicum]KAH9557844.1 hypothetical protein CY35_07G106000 [Sphagnum magellanicum]
MSQLEMPGASSLLDLRMPEDETHHKCLKTLVQYLNWTYGVIWKLSPGDRFDLEWVDGWFDPTSFKSGHALMPQFYSIFKTCNFKDPSAHGYSALALRQVASFWWTSQMEEVPTDKCKARFLQEARIQTIVCIPRLGADGMYCAELATTALVSKTDALMDILQEYVSTLLTPHMFSALESPSESSLSSMVSLGQEYPNSNQFSSPAVVPPLNSRTTAAAQMMAPGSSGFVPPLDANRYIPGDFNESLGSSGTILRQEEPYFQWTTPGNQSLFFGYGSGLFDEPDTDADVEKTMFNSLDSSKGASKSASSLGVMGPCTWDSDTLEPEEVVIQAPAVPDFPVEHSIEHSRRMNSVSLPAQSAEDLLVLLAGPKPHATSASKCTMTANLPTDAQFSSFSHLLETGSVYDTPEAQVKTMDQATSSIDPFCLKQSTHMSFLQNLSGWPPNDTKPLMDVYDNGLALPALCFRHNKKSLFQRRVGFKLSEQGRDGHPARQSLLRKWTEKIVPMIEEDAQQQKFAEQELARLHSTPSSGDSARRSNPAQDEAAHIHKLAERCRRSKFNEKMHTLCTIVPIIKKKDRVSVLSHTIDYIRQLTTQVAHLEKADHALKPKKGADYPHPPARTTLIQAQDDSSLDARSSSGSLVKVAVCPNDDGLVINVEASNKTETLIRILSSSRELGLEIRSFNSIRIDDQVQVTVNVVAQGAHEMSSMDVQEALQRFLVVSDGSLPV